MKKILSTLKKLNPFDVFMIIIALSILFGFFFFFYRRAEYITIQVKVTNQEVLYAATLPKNSYSRYFTVGDVERDAVGRVISEVIDVESYPVSSENQAVYLTLKVRSTFDTRTKTYSARGKTLMYGTPMRFNLSSVTFDGFVTQVPNTSVSHKQKIMLVQAVSRYVEPATAKVIKAGDTIINSKNEVLIKITSVRVEPAIQVTTNISGDLLERRNPYFKDIYLDMEVLVDEFNNKDLVLLDEIKFQVGAVVPFSNKNYTIYPMIEKILTE
jgi:hypothetical protein